MPIVSVKLPESTKAQLAQLAESRGVTAHAVMVQAIEAAISNAQVYDQFVSQAVITRERLAVDRLLVDGPAFATYLRAKATGDSKVVRPAPKLMADL